MRRVTFQEWFTENVSRDPLQVAADNTSAQGLVICPVATCQGRDIGENCQEAGEIITHDDRRLRMFYGSWLAGDNTAYVKRYPNAI